MPLNKEGIVPNILDRSFDNNSLSISQQISRDVIETHVGEIIEAVPIMGGLVSYVYRVVGKETTGIVKLKQDYFAQVPNILVDPDHIAYEYAALQLFSEISPSNFPTPLAFIPEERMIVMTDIMPDGKTLEDRLNHHEASTGDMYILGKTLGVLNKKLSRIDSSIRDGHDKDDYEGELYYRLGLNRGNKTLDALNEKLKSLPKQMIIGDLSPKNIGRGSDGQVTICDLESCYFGDTIFSLGYLAGHILIHNLDSYNFALESISALLLGYSSENSDIDTNDLVLKQICLATLLYRLDNPVIPYDIPLNKEQTQDKIAKTIGLLEEKELTWENLILRIAS